MARNMRTEREEKIRLQLAGSPGVRYIHPAQFSRAEFTELLNCLKTGSDLNEAYENAIRICRFFSNCCLAEWEELEKQFQELHQMFEKVTSAPAALNERWNELIELLIAWLMLELNSDDYNAISDACEHWE